MPVIRADRSKDPPIDRESNGDIEVGEPARRLNTRTHRTLNIGHSHINTKAVRTMQIHVPDLHEPTKPNPGLVAIMNARVREEALSSMMKHVREQAGMMNRIHWEERTEQTEGVVADGRSSGARPNPRGGQGVRDSLTECPEALETRFVRCALSEIVEDIKSEDAQRKKLIEQRREGARLRREEAERQAETARAEADAERARRRSYAVKSMDKLGGTISDAGHEGGGRRVGCVAVRKAESRPTNAGDHYLAIAAAKLSSNDAM